MSLLKKQQKQAKSTMATTTVNQSHLRLSFLEQAAACLTAQSSTTTAPSMDLLARLLQRECREVGFVEQLRMHRDYKRSFCKKCFKCWLPSKDGETPFKIKKDPAKKSITRVCKECGHAKRFNLNAGYKSRNEKAEAV